MEARFVDPTKINNYDFFRTLTCYFHFLWFLRFLICNNLDTVGLNRLIACSFFSAETHRRDRLYTNRNSSSHMYQSFDLKHSKKSGNSLSYSVHDETARSEKLSVAQTLGIIRHRHSFHHFAPKHNNRRRKYQSLASQGKHYGSLDQPKNNGIENSTNASSELFDWREDIKSLKSLIFGSYLNLFLILLPFCFISYYMNFSGTWIFFINFFTMIPLASILGDSTEMLAEHLGIYINYIDHDIN